MKLNNYSEDDIKETLEFFHSSDTVNDLYGFINAKKNPLDRFTLHCDLSCGENCPIHEQCFQKQFIALNRFIIQKTKELPIESSIAYLQKLLNN
jgi:hypothetical protein